MSLARQVIEIAKIQTRFSRFFFFGNWPYIYRRWSLHFFIENFIHQFLYLRLCLLRDEIKRQITRATCSEKVLEIFDGEENALITNASSAKTSSIIAKNFKDFPFDYFLATIIYSIQKS